MAYKNRERQALASRGGVRTFRHGNWRQTYIDCMGMCIAHVNGDPTPCGLVEGLELHEIWGESSGGSQVKFQQRILLCNLHHSLLEDRAHQTEFMLWQYRPSVLQQDITLDNDHGGLPGVDREVAFRRESHRLSSVQWPTCGGL